jgi:vacuolar-type H+-ATPase subunit E/Vma4
MSLENVEKAVLAEAEAEAARILAEARASLDGKLADARREVERRFESRHKREMARLQSEHNRELSRARTDARLAVLKEKNRIIEEAFAAALERADELPKDAFLKLAAGWLASVPDEISGRIVASERERSYLAGEFLEKVNASRSGKLELSDEPGPAGGGMVVRSEKFKFDFSWAERLDDRKGSLAPEVAGIIFGDGEEAG